MKHIKHINEGGYHDEEIPPLRIDDFNERPESEVLFQLVYGSYLEEHDTDLLYNEDRFENTIFMKKDDGSLWLMSISGGSAQAIEDLNTLEKKGLGPYVSDSNAEEYHGASSGDVIAIWDLENLATDMYKDGEWTDNFEDFEFGLGSEDGKFGGIGFLKIIEEDVVDDLIDTVRKSQMKIHPRIGTGFEGWAHMRDKKRQDYYSMARFRGHGFAYRTTIKALHDYGQVLKKQSDKSGKD